MVGKTPSALAPPESGGDRTGAMLEGMKSRGRWTGEVPFVRKDGTSGVADTVVVPLSDEFGRRIAALGISRDVTDRKNFEQLKRDRDVL
jgi:PAS domain S-box-containing protein